MLAALALHVLAVQPQLQNGIDPISTHVLQPIFPGRYTKLVYNRVPKTGSTTMIKLAQQLAKKNNFKLVVDNEYFPNAWRLAEIISALPDRTMYINHCNLWMDAPDNVGFFNMVRHPFEHDESWFYYGVDPDARPQELAEKELGKRKAKGACGCYKLEYDKCVHIRHANNCSLQFSGANFRQFCNSPEKWGHDQSKKESMHTPASDTKFWCDTTQSLLSKYVFVGLTEQYVRSVATLERLLPDWFTGASELIANATPAKQTHMKNNVTGTYKMGCISKVAKNLLLSDDTNRAEMDFYDNAEALFWKQYYDKKAFNKLRMKRFDFDVDDSYDGSSDESFMSLR